VRVLLLTHYYPRWPGDLSGAALSALARALVRRGLSVRVLVPSDDPTGRAELEGVGINRVRVSRKVAGTVERRLAWSAIAAPAASRCQRQTPWLTV
jgi:hypothetical protein